MKERERILELVKQGVLSTEDALDLLENLAQKETQESVRKDYSQAEKAEQQKEPVEETQSDDAEDFTEKSDEKEKQNKRKQLEDKMERLANEASAHSVKIDRLNMQINEYEKQISDKEAVKLHLQALADLDNLSEEKNEQMESLIEEIEDLNEKVELLQEEKYQTIQKLQSVKRSQLGTQAKQFTEKLDIPEDWKETAAGAWSQVGEKVSRVGSDLSRTLKETFDSVADNVDWKDINMKVPGIVSASFSHEFVFPQSKATILDFKFANGDVTFKRSSSEEIRIEADIKVYGKLENQTPMEAFEERSSISENGEQLKFHVPNKRIRCKAVVYLPEREYDYTSVNVLNGKVSFNQYKGKDLFVKSTNGDLVFDQTEAVMLEVKGTNGNVLVSDSRLRDVLVHTINGDVSLKGMYDSSALTTVNGTIRATLTGEKATRLEANSVNGAIKIAVPSDWDIEGEVHTNFGKINSRLTGEEVLSEKKDRTSKSRRFQRVKQDNPFKLNAGTTTGNILMKDSE